MEHRDLSSFYLDILDYYIEEYEWLEMFRFNDQCSIVQDSALFSPFILVGVKDEPRIIYLLSQFLLWRDKPKGLLFEDY